MSTVANRHRGKSEKPYREDMFMPFEPKPIESPEDLSAKLKAALSSLKGK